MCGILGYSQLPDITKKNQRLVLQLTRQLFCASLIRGDDATGYACYSRDIPERSIWTKSPLAADEFVRYGYLDLTVLPTAFIGHVRAATDGKPMYNVNNHPFIGEHYSLVHNGVIHNWNNINTLAALRAEMTSETDSELFLIYLEKHNGDLHGLPRYFTTGTYALAFLNNQTGDITLTCDNVYPIVIVDFRDSLQCTFFVSTAAILRKALQTTFQNFPNYEIIKLPPYKAYQLKRGTLQFQYDIQKPYSVVPHAQASSGRQTKTLCEKKTTPHEVREHEVSEHEVREHEVSEIEDTGTLDPWVGLTWEGRQRFIEAVGEENAPRYAREFIDMYSNGDEWLHWTMQDELELIEHYLNMFESEVDNTPETFTMEEQTDWNRQIIADTPSA